MKRIVNLVLIMAALVLTPLVAQAGDMLNGGTWLQLAGGASVSINPSFGYYPIVRAELGLDRFLIAGGVGSVLGGSSVDSGQEIASVEGAFQLAQLKMPWDKSGNGRIFLYFNGGVSSEQGSYALLTDGSQWRLGPKTFWDWDAAKPGGPNIFSWMLGVYFMGTEIEDVPGATKYSVNYLAVETAIVARIP